MMHDGVNQCERAEHFTGALRENYYVITISMVQKNIPSMAKVHELNQQFLHLVSKPVYTKGTEFTSGYSNYTDRVLYYYT